MVDQYDKSGRREEIIVSKDDKATHRTFFANPDQDEEDDDEDDEEDEDARPEPSQEEPLEEDDS